MGGAEIRGFLAFITIAVVVGYLWVRIDTEPESADVVVATTTTTATSTTTTVATTTTTPGDALLRVCDQARAFAAAAEEIPDDAGRGPAARLAAEFWPAVISDLPVDVRTEAVAVVEFYETYMAIAEPLDHDPVRIIIEGDKETYEQLITRPAPGLETSRGFLLFECATEVPDKPWMSASGFSRLEERLLDPDPLET